MSTTLETPTVETTTAPQGTRFADVDPGTLTLEANVRRDANLTREFIASIREHGVLTPVLVQRQEDGSLLVRAGQRRTLAAVETGQATIPAYIVDGDDDQARRIIEQLTENEHRSAVTDADLTAAFRQLKLDFGLSAAQIAKRTSTRKATVQAVLKVATCDVATAVQAEHDLTLDRALVIAEFADDPDTVAQLTTTATTEPEDFDHLAQQLRDERDEREALDAARQALTAQGVRVIDETDGMVESLSRLRPGADDPIGTELTVEAHATCPGHAAHVSTLYDGTVKERYVCTSWENYGHAVRWPASLGAAPRTGPMTEEQKAERRTVVANNKAWRSAETVRRAWLANLAKRKTAPKGAAEFIARIIATDPGCLTGGKGLAVKWLNLTGGTGWNPDRTALVAAIDTATPGRAQVITLTLILAAIENGTGTHTWRNAGATTRAYFTALSGWGYNLAPVERLAAGEEPPADDEPADESADE